MNKENIKNKFYVYVYKDNKGNIFKAKLEKIGNTNEKK